MWPGSPAMRASTVLASRIVLASRGLTSDGLASTGRPAGLRSKPSGIEAPPGGGDPGATTEDRPFGARGRGLRDVSVVDMQLWVAGNDLQPGDLGRLAADAEALPDGAVPVDVLLGQVLEQPAATADQQQQPAAAVVVV